MNDAYLHSPRARTPLRAPLAVALATALGVAAMPGLALATTYTVTSAGDAGNGTCGATCTLRDAITAANANAGADVITFASTLSGDTITLNIAGKGNIEITDDLTIQGPGATLLTVSGGNVASGGNGGILDVTSSTYLTVAISGITLVDGKAPGKGGALSFGSGSLTLSYVAIQNSYAQTFGGGFYKSSGTVTVTHSTISGNSVGNSGGGFNSNYGTVELIDSTVSSNEAAGSGGGFYARASITVNNSTISGNTAGNVGGGFLLEKFDGVLTNSIVANNTASGNSTEFYAAPIGSSPITVTANYSLIEGNYDVNGTFSSSNNIFRQDPLLGPLADNGGPTQTLALLPGSPAIDAGDDATCETTDQRGVARPQGPHCDMGAFELVPDLIFANGFE